MANYSQLKAAIADVIKTNGTQAITGQVLQDVLNSMVSVIGANYTFAGVATPSTNPGTPDQNVVYMASQAGTYINFGAKVLPSGIYLLMWNGSWSVYNVLENYPYVLTHNIFSTIGITEGKILLKTGSGTQNFPSWGYTDYIDIEGISELKIYTFPTNAGCFYDSGKNYISGFGATGSTEYNVTIQVPANATYVRYNTRVSTRNNDYIIDVSKTKVYQNYPYLNFADINMEDLSASLRTFPVFGRRSKVINGNLLAQTTWTDGKYLNQAGTEVVLSNQSYSDYIDIHTYTKLKISRVAENAGCFYDENQNYLSGFGYVGGIDNYVIEIPENAYYIRVNSSITDRDNGYAYLINANTTNFTVEYPWLKTPTNQWFSKKIVWMGTSIPYGQTSESGVSNPMPNPYPSLVAKKLGATVVNVAQPGMAVETNSDGTAKTNGSFSLTIAELTAQGKATTPYKSYENAMLGQNADLYVFDCEPNNSNLDVSVLDNFDFNTWQWTDGKTFAQHRDSYLGAMIYLINQLMTENTAHRFVFVSEVAYARDGKITDVYPNRVATEALAEKLNAHVIDVAGKLLYNKLNRDVYLNTDNGSYLHPKVITHKIIADILCNELTLI